jgi:ABC-2 type transport system permease protein
VTGRVLAVVMREWAELRRNRVVLLSVVLPPLLFAGFPLLFLHSGALAGLAAATPQLGGMRQGRPDLAGLSDRQALEVLLLGQFLALLLLAPISAPLTIASYSIVGEKQLHTLEPLLATPIRTWELLLAKALAAALPGAAAGWLGYSLLTLGARPVLGPAAFAYLIGPTGLLLAFLLAPLLALVGVGLATVASSRTDDPRAAQQVGAVVVLPVVGLLFAQAGGALYLGPGLVLAASLVAALADVALLIVAARLFRRETILTRWR